MSQISPPIRIVLIGAVVFLAAWFTILKPKPVTAETDPAVPAAATTTATTSTAKTAYGKAVAKAKSVAASAAATSTPTPVAGAAATPAPAVETPAQPPIAIPDADLAKLPKDVADALKARKILVLGVFADGAKAIRPQADDDRYVRGQLRNINHYDGDVFVKQIAISELSTYGSLVNDLGVHQSPSVVIIDRDLKGRVLTGYTDRFAINQVIADIRRESTEPRITDTYLRDLNAYCGDRKLRLSRLSYPTSSSKKAWLATSDEVHGRDPRLRARARSRPSLGQVADGQDAAPGGGQARHRHGARVAGLPQAARPQRRAQGPDHVARRQGVQGRRSLQPGRPHQLRGQPAVLDSSGRGPRAF